MFDVVPGQSRENLLRPRVTKHRAEKIVRTATILGRKNPSRAWTVPVGKSPLSASTSAEADEKAPAT
jgi:hypothetical protein